MNTDYKVAEVKLSYRNRVPNKDRKRIMDSCSAYKILRNNYSDDTIDYRETFKVLYMNQGCQAQIQLINATELSVWRFGNRYSYRKQP